MESQVELKVEGMRIDPRQNLGHPFQGEGEEERNRDPKFEKRRIGKNHMKQATAVED